MSTNTPASHIVYHVISDKSMIFRFVFISQGELSRKYRKFKSHPIIGNFRYLVVTYCYCRYLLLLLLTVSKKCFYAFLLKGLWRVLFSFLFIKNISIRQRVLKILIKRCTYFIFIFFNHYYHIHRTFPTSQNVRVRNRFISHRKLCQLYFQSWILYDHTHY